MEKITVDSCKRIIVATGNNGKMREIRELFGDTGIPLVSMREFWKASIDIEESGSTFLENAQIKADWVFNHSNQQCALADDSGLVVDALDGAPGVHSARFAGVHGDTAANNRKLLGMLELVPAEKRTARFVCAMVLRLSSDILLRAEGACEGKIIMAPRGSEGFGYDPLFMPVGYDMTFAELPGDVKNRISHRGKALHRIRELMNDYIQ